MATSLTEMQIMAQEFWDTLQRHGLRLQPGKCELIANEFITGDTVTFGGAHVGPRDFWHHQGARVYD
eukprot:9371778-Alexandrium_andersonii.AAC.1